MSVRRLGLTTLVWLCALVGSLVLSGASALAFYTHPYLCQITAGSIPSATECNGTGNIVPGGSFGTLKGVAVDGTGRVYVSDGEKRAVDVFDSSGTFTNQLTGASPSAPFTEPWGVAVDGSNNVWVADVGPGLMDKFDSSGKSIAQGTGEGHWTGKYTESVAFSNASGHLYVSDSNKDDLWVLNSDGSFNSDIPGTEATWGDGCCFISTAADNSGGAANGDLYVASSNRTVTRVDGTGKPVSFSGSASYISGARLTGTPAGSFSSIAGVMVDSAGHVYVLDDTGGPFSSGVVYEFASTGLYLGQTSGSRTPNGSFNRLAGAAVSPSGDLYVTDQGLQGVVDVFGPGVVLATVTTGAASSVTKSSATLEGVVNPDGTSVTGCEFEYRTQEEASYTHTVACSQPLPLTGTTPISVSANATGLTGNTYHYRLAATNANGTNIGSAGTVVIPTAVDALSTGPAEAVTPTGATLTGSLSPDGTDTHYYFQYGTDTTYGSTSPALPGTDAGTVSESVRAETTLSALSGSTVYHYRLVGVNSFGTTYGQDATFRTSGPPRIEAESFTGLGSTHTTLCAQINPDGLLTHYHFEYGTTTGYGTSIPIPDGEIPAGFSVETVCTNATGLQPNTTYHFRVLTSNEGGTVNGTDQTLTTLPPVLIDSTFTTNVASTSVDLRALINPVGNATHYHFEYGTTTSYGQSVPNPDQELAIGEEDQTVSQHIQNLTPNTTYHYRVVANNTFGTITGPDQTFTTQQTGTQFALPDGRQWELVSPPNKHGAQIGSLYPFGTTQAAVDGGAITYHANVPMESDPRGYSWFSQLVSVRGGEGWSSRDISLPHSGQTGGGANPNEFPFFSLDLSLSIAFASGNDGTLLSDRASEVTPYVRSEALCNAPAIASECFVPVLTGKEGFADVPTGTKFAGTGGIFGYQSPFEGASPDLKHVVLQTNKFGGGQIYEWSAGATPAEALQLVSAMPASEGGGPSPDVPSGVGQGGGPYAGSRHSISDDGSRIFWAIGDPSRPTLYLRDMVRRETVGLDVPQPGAPNGSEPFYTRFQIANSDGSKAFFKSGSYEGIKGRRLTAQSSQNGNDLYECMVVEDANKLKCKLTDLTPEVGGNPSEVFGVSGASEDASYLYFAANGVFGNGAEHGAKQGTCGSGPPSSSATCNLYEYHNGTMTFIATLSESDENDFSSLPELTAQVSPNGRYLTFMSQRSLTGYDNRDANSGKPDMEVYLFDAVSKNLSCVSCNPTGSRPVGFEVSETDTSKPHQKNFVNIVRGGGAFNESSWVAANLPAQSLIDKGNALYQQRLVSDSGRVFFNSNDALAPQDVNGNEDVYEFEPAGTGDCTVASVTFNASSGGCVGLISSGTSPSESGFLDASKGGGDVFFLTAGRLTSHDYDNAFDVYDAHECSASSPCVAAPVSAPPCSSGDSCKPSPALQPPIFGAPPSATFTGAGNVTNSPGSSVVAGRSLTRAQKLARALRECRKRPERKRAVCRSQARGRYGVKGARKATRKAQG
jgi:hypothetical protein